MRLQIFFSSYGILLAYTSFNKSIVMSSDSLLTVLYLNYATQIILSNFQYSRYIFYRL